MFAAVKVSQTTFKNAILCFSALPEAYAIAVSMMPCLTLQQISDRQTAMQPVQNLCLRLFEKFGAFIVAHRYGSLIFTLQASRNLYVPKNTS